MRSGWFWRTPAWEAYQEDYFRDRPRPMEWKSSPLADDHDLFLAGKRGRFESTTLLTTVIDLETLAWGDVRDSYRNLINKAKKLYTIEPCDDIEEFKTVHRMKNGVVRNDATFAHNGQWMKDGMAFLMGAKSKGNGWVAFAYWIVYRGNAYYASGPSLVEDVQHAVVWKSLEYMKDRGVKLVEMGAPKDDKDIFKGGFGGKQVPFTVMRQL